MDMHEFYMGNVFDAYEFFGAHPNPDGTVFRTFAPSAERITIIGEWNDWQEENMIKDGHVWSYFSAKAKKGQMYKYVIYSSLGRVEHCDPYGFAMELRPNFASIITDLDEYKFTDSEWLEKRSKNYNEPLNIYEVHIGSWHTDPDNENGWYSYSDIADKLIKYVKKHHYTHIEVLQKYNFNFQKKFGQNFLIDTGILEEIIDSAGITKDDMILEIGPGIGTMTQYLCESARQVIAVEIDTNLIPILKDTLSEYDNVKVINDDILKVDINALAEEYNNGKPIKVVANLPYYITTPIIMGLFESHVPIDSITIMVQKEVADRMQAGPGKKDYGALSLAVQYYSHPEIVVNVPPSCFMPQPKVGSSVISLKRYEKPVVDVDDEKLMFKIIRASFNQRRKTLANGLNNFGGMGLTKEQIQQSIEALGVPVNVRGEALSLAQFAQLSNIIGAAK